MRQRWFMHGLRHAGDDMPPPIKRYMPPNLLAPETKAAIHNVESVKSTGILAEIQELHGNNTE